ncbi:hypothetical protein BH20ACT2_BH20ACT2_13530 [soil metagenome]
MDRATVEIYEASARHYAERRKAQQPERTEAFAAALAPGAIRVDLGCGPGLHLPLLGTPVVAVDAAAAMLDVVGEAAPYALRVRADLEHVPLRRGSVAGVWASKSHQHVPAERLPLALAELHRILAVGGRLELALFRGDGDWISDDDLPGRYFAWWQPDALADVLVGAGFLVDELVVTGSHGRLVVTATRARTLADIVGPGMRQLVCGLNPSLYAADVGVGFARPGNRFWPALAAAGRTGVDRDPLRLLGEHHIGMTDLVKRATVAAAELTAEEYRDGLARVERLVHRLRPAAVCFVGLAGWRAAVDRRATAGVQPGDLGGAPVYVMPSTSGLNTHATVAGLAAHLQAATGLASR